MAPPLPSTLLHTKAGAEASGVLLPLLLLLLMEISCVMSRLLRSAFSSATGLISLGFCVSGHCYWNK